MTEARSFVLRGLFVVLALSACASGPQRAVPVDSSHVPFVPAAAFRCDNAEREDPTRRHHRAREPLVRQPLSGLSKRRHRLERHELEGPDHPAAAGRTRRAVRHRSLGERDVRRVRRHGRAARDATAGWTASISEESISAAVQSGVRVRAARESKPYFDSRARIRAGRPHVPVAPRRELRRAPISHRRRKRTTRVDLPAIAWGCDGGPSDMVKTITAARARTARPEVACFDYPTLGRRTRRAPA